MLKSFDYFFVLRPMLFFPGWSTLIAGYLIHSKSDLYFTFAQIRSIDYLELTGLLILFAAAMGGSFLLNQLQDIESDLKNKKLFLLSEKYISPKAAWIETLILLVIALIFAYKIGTFVLASTALFIFITGYAYNFKPLQLKNFPIGSLIANAIMGWLAFALGWFTVNEDLTSFLKDSLPYLLFNTSLYLFTTLPDIKGDRISKKKTLAVIYGIKPVINLAALLYLLSIAGAFYAKDYWALMFILPALPFYLFTLADKRVELTTKTTKFAILFFAVAVCLKIPFYFVLMITMFMATRWYFQKRFNYDYPNFKGE